MYYRKSAQGNAWTEKEKIFHLLVFILVLNLFDPLSVKKAVKIKVSLKCFKLAISVVRNNHKKI